MSLVDDGGRSCANGSHREIFSHAFGDNVLHIANCRLIVDNMSRITRPTTDFPTRLGIPTVIASRVIQTRLMQGRNGGTSASITSFAIFASSVRRTWALCQKHSEPEWIDVFSVKRHHQPEWTNSPAAHWRRTRSFLPRLRLSASTVTMRSLGRSRRRGGLTLSDGRFDLLGGGQNKLMP
jgi:hypothetical protein